MKTDRIATVTVMVLAFSPAANGTAAVKNWSALSGSWNTSSNWSPTGVPGTGDDVNIKPTDGVSRTVTYDYSGPPVMLNSLGIDLNGGVGSATTTFSMSANNLTVGELDVGWSGFGGSGGNGTFTQSGGVATVNGAGLYVGVNATDKGTYNLNGTASLVASSTEVIGSSGVGAFNHSGGTNSVTGANNLYLGFNAGSTGTYTLSGGALVANQTECVGYAGAGTFNHSAGTNTINASALGSLTVGNLAGATGVYSLSGTGALVSHASEFIGNLGRGTFNQTGGSNSIVGAGTRLQIGYGTASVGVYNLSGGSLTTDEVKMGNVGGGSIPAQGYFNHSGGTLNIAGDMTLGGDVGSGGRYTQTGGVTTVGGQLGLGPNLGFGTYALGNAGVLSANTLRIGNAAIDGSGTFDQTGGTNTIDALNLDNGEYNLNGGTLRFNTYARSAQGTFHFNAGTIQLAGNRSIGTDPAIVELFGNAPKLLAGKGLTVEASAALLTTVTLDGGAFSAGQVVNGNQLLLQRGTLNLTNQAVTIGSNGPLGSTLELNDDMTVNVTLGVTNQGLVTGDGQIGGTFANAAAGELRAEPGQSLKLTGANNTNAGQVNLYGGMLEFTQNLTNAAAGFISGNGTLKTSALANNGTMNFSGLANIVGDVTNSASGKIISSGGGPTTFFDDVINQGQIRTTAGSFTVFYGAVTGAGTFTGPGTVNFEGDLKPGNSPAQVNFAGDVILGADSTLQIEIGGGAPGAQYDQLNVAGELTLDGTLEIALINGFTPTLGQTFDFLNSASLSGAFSAIQFPTLPGLAWNTSQLATGILSVTLPGDFNGDGTVNGSDLNNWKTGFGTSSGATNMQGDADGDADVDGADFLVWQRQLGSSGVLSASTVVPEPASLLLFIAAALGSGRMGGRLRQELVGF